MKSFNPHSVKHYRKLGYFSATVDKWVRFKGNVITQDLWRFADVIAFDRDTVILCQATSLSNLGSRIRKAVAIPEANAWVQSPHRRLEFHGWFKVAGRWRVKIKTLRFSAGSADE